MSDDPRKTSQRDQPPGLRDPGEFRILALSGGGYLGLYSAAVLAALEAQIGEPIGRRFDLIAGTSVGGILAAAVAFELPLSQLVEYFVDQGDEVFSSRALPSGRVARLVDLSRSVLGPKYSGRALRQLLEQRLGQARFADALHPLLLPAVNVTTSQTKVFKTPHAPASRGDEHVSVADAVLAACAAPAYFAPVPIGGSLFADGGLFAVAPDQVALHEAEHFMGIDVARVRMLSIGTATVGYQPAEGIDADAGAVGWLSDGRLIMTLIAVGQQHVQAMMEDRLGARYLRIDARWPADAGLGIDIATPQAAKVLTRLARQSVKALDRQRLAAFL
ncbi:MAG: patatin-like phospholipase family protein [Rubrivivax sp.]|nr:patatin-like phospholipase family protein [Rubrivivax sp.]MBK7260587.1 patatin-like phospholipase family protein [Rubrivivax sp.]